MDSKEELQERLFASNGHLQAVRTQIAAAKQSKRMSELTVEQVRSESAEAPIWQGAGRMFFKTSRQDFEKQTADRQKELDEQISSLEKKELYHKTTSDKLLKAFDQHLKN